MFLDDGFRGWGEPQVPHCKGCKQPIGPDSRIETVQFPEGNENRLEEMNGVYHASCAKPLLSIAHALTMLSRPFFT